MEAAGQPFHLFRDGLDYAFILHRARDAPERGVLSGSSHDDPILVPAPPLEAVQPVYESLQGKQVGLVPPLGVARSLLPATSGFTE